MVAFCGGPNAMQISRAGPLKASDTKWLEALPCFVRSHGAADGGSLVLVQVQIVDIKADDEMGVIYFFGLDCRDEEGKDK
jgi:hypothetical protein